MGARYALGVRVIARRTLGEFWVSHPDAEQPLRAWYSEAYRASWQTPQEIKASFRSASIVGNSRVVFNIAGNKYRLVVAVAYRWQTMWVRFVGTHAEYDKVDVEHV
jgi:mRNA interferase HigB